MGKLAYRGVRLSRLGSRGRGIVNVITGTPPVLAPLTDGDTLSSAVTWGGPYTSEAGTVDVVQQMQINGGAWVAYNGATVVADDETYAIRENTSVGEITRPFPSATQTVSGIAPQVAASDSLAGRTLTITTGTLTGVPTPDVTLTALTLGGVDVLGDQTGTRSPWEYDVPSSVASQTVAWTVTAENNEGTDTASGSEAVAADLFAPAITASDALVGRILTITVDTLTGEPNPSTTLTTLTLDGVSVLGDQTGTGPWEYDVPDDAFSQTVAWTVTASNGIDPDATATGSEVVAANLSAPTANTAPTITGTLTAGETVTINEGTYNGTTPITITGILTLDGADVTADMVGSNYTIPSSVDTQSLVWNESASNGYTPDASQSVTESIAPDLFEPTADGNLPEVFYTEGTGVQTVDASVDFNDAVDGTWSVTGGGSTINASGLVSIPTSSLLAGVIIAVTYNNDLGSATSSFPANVSAAALAPTLDSVTFTDTSDGTPDLLELAYTGDVTGFRVYIATGDATLNVTDAQLYGGSGGTGVLEFTDFDIGTEIPLTGLTSTSNAATRVAVALIRESDGEAASNIAVQTVSGMNFSAFQVASVATNTAGDALTVTFPLVCFGTQDTGDFVVSGVAAGTPTITSVTGFGTDTLTIGLSTNLPVSTDTITLAYTNTDSDIRDPDANFLANFSGQAVTNNVTPVSSGITLTPTTTGPVGVTGDPTVSFDVDVGAGGDVVGALVYFTWEPSGRYAVSATIDGVAAVDFERSHSASTEQIVTFRATGVSAGTVTVTVTFNNTIINLDDIRGYAWTASGSITSAGTAIEASVDPFVDGVGLTVPNPMTAGQTAICIYRPAAPYVGMTVTGATAHSSGATGAPAIFAHYDATSALTQDINFVNAVGGDIPASANGTAVVFS